MKSNAFINNQRGMALVLSCLVITLVTAYGSAMMVQSLTEHRTVNRYSDLAVAFQLAESGVDQAIANLLAGGDEDLASTALNGGTYAAEIEYLGDGHYEITSHGTVGLTQRNLEVVIRLGGESVLQYPLFGEEEVKLKKKTYTDSYNSSEAEYDADTAGERGDIATNNTEDDSITIAKDSEVHGQVIVGPDMDDPDEAVELAENVTITANPTIVSAPESFELPAIDTSGLECEGNFTLPDNETYTFTEAKSPYCFDKLEADKGSVIAVSGNVTVYASNVDFDKSLQVNVGGKPTQFPLKVYGDSDVVIDKEGTFKGAIYAPEAKVHLKKEVTLYGAIAAEGVELEKESFFHFDEDLINYGPTVADEVEIKSWREL